MMQRFFQLETVIRRAPLGLRFLDLVRGVTVNDGLVVMAWALGTRAGARPAPTALRSPLSGVYGFRSLPGLRRFEMAERPASDWCGSPPQGSPPEPTAVELTDLDTLRGLYLATEESPPRANFIISVEDRMERFLPQTLLMCLPKERLIEVPLLSSPARLAPAGLGVVRGEVIRQQDAQPAAWALVTVSPDNGVTDYVAITDARGMFTLFVPYANPLPSLQGSPPHGSGTLDQLTWPLTIRVFYQPSRQRFVPGLDPPDMLSILEQAVAEIYDQIGVHSSTLMRPLRFGVDVVITTVYQSQLLLDPAPP
ncbi:MAG: hypothetical protein ACJ788_14805 [Ktedonobacteraceae bacterium]